MAGTHSVRKVSQHLTPGVCAEAAVPHGHVNVEYMTFLSIWGYIQVKVESDL